MSLRFLGFASGVSVAMEDSFGFVIILFSAFKFEAKCESLPVTVFVVLFVELETVRFQAK
ncbi:MAG: hypothetical protein MHM6MM_008012 [Cercozoa sp. M6MM]